MFKYKDYGVGEKPKMDMKQKLHTTISLLALTVMALTTATYAWFTLSASTRVRDLEIDVTAGANLKIATYDRGDNIELYFDEVVGTDADTSDKQAYAEIDTWMQNEYGGLSIRDIKLAPRTTSDGENFYTEYGTSAENNPNLTSGSYMEFELYLIASEAMRVHLSTVDDGDGYWTHIEATANDNGSTLTDIEECVRVCFDCKEDGRTVVWEPNKKNDTPAFHSNHTVVDTIELPGHNVEDYTDETWICELEPDTAKLVTVRVWIEGEDPYCVDEVQRARFKMDLRFQGTNENNEVLS